MKLLILPLGFFALLCTAVPATINTDVLTTFNNNDITKNTLLTTTTPNLPRDERHETKLICGTMMRFYRTMWICNHLNPLQCDKICNCYIGIWSQQCATDFGYGQCTYVTDTWGGDGNAGVDAGVDTDAISSSPNEDDDDVESEVVADEPSTTVDLVARGTPRPRLSSPLNQVAAEKCLDAYLACQQLWICAADRTNCPRLCNCYVGIQNKQCGVRGYWRCKHGQLIAKSIVI